MKTKPVIPVFFASDKNYLPYLAVAFHSLAKNASDKNLYKVYVLTDSLDNDDLLKLKKHETENVTIELVDVNSKIESIKKELSVNIRDYYSISIFFRLFIPGLFPQYKKAIYLDCDIVLMDDIAKLYNTKIGNNYLCGVLDETVYTNPTFIKYVNEALDVPETKYINSGVLVMNLDKFRKYSIDKNFCHWLFSYNFGTVAPDQDYLNVLCKDSIVYVDRGWNQQPLGTKENPRDSLHLIHYNMFFKPWKYENTLYKDYFWNYAKDTEYYDYIKQQLAGYSDDKKLKDKQAAEGLLKYALELVDSGNTYKATVLKK